MISSNRIIQLILALAYTLGFFTILYMFVTGKAKIDEANLELVKTLVTLLTGVQMIIINHYFTSSFSSSVKNDTIEKLTVQKQNGNEEQNRINELK